MSVSAERIKNRRTAKKGSITKRIGEITQLINDNGSRTKVKFLLEKLLVVRDEAIVLDTELAALDKNHDDSWIENEKERCDTIEGDVKEYLESRADDPASVSSIAASWVERHQPEVDSVLGELTKNTASWTLHDQYTTAADMPKYTMHPPHLSGTYDLGGQYTYSSLPLSLPQDSFRSTQPPFVSHPPLRNTYPSYPGACSAANVARTNATYSTRHPLGVNHHKEHSADDPPRYQNEQLFRC